MSKSEWPASDARREAPTAEAPLGDLDGGEQGPPPTFGPDPSQRYREQEELGKGAMGRVTAVFDGTLGRRVAAKHLTSSRADPERFIREARITARLEHPNIVTVHDAGTSADGTLFYTMKLVEGQSLKTLLEGRTDFQSRLALLPHFLAVCQGMAYAHERGVLHRDLKPDNIMVGDFGETLIVDWGVAKIVGAPEPCQQAMPLEGNQTAAGMIIGTPAYMSPEQTRGEPLRASSDVFSLGVVLYELLAGKRPFNGGDSKPVIRLIREIRSGDFPSLAESCSQAPPELAAIAHRALATHPAKRYASAIELANEIEAFQHGRRVAAYHYSGRELLTRLLQLYRVPLLVVALIVAVVGVSATVTLVKTQAAEASARKGLSFAIAREAVGLAKQGEPVHALLLAATSMSHHPNAVARGVIAGAASQPGPSLLPVRSRAGCSRLVPHASGEGFVCDEGAAASRFGWDLGEPVWSVEHPDLVQIMVDDTVHLFSHLQVQERSWATGELLGAPRPLEGGRSWVQPHSAIKRVSQLKDLSLRLVSAEGQEASFDLGSMARRVRVNPSGDALLAVTVDRTFQLAHKTSDGTWSLTHEGALDVFDIEAGRTNGELFLAMDGEVRLTRWTDPERAHWTLPHEGLVHALELSADRSLLLVVGEGEAVVWDLESRRVAASIPVPAVATAIFVAGSHDVVVATQDALSRWRLPNRATHRRQAQQGVTTVDQRPGHNAWLWTGSGRQATVWQPDGEQQTFGQVEPDLVLKAARYSPDGAMLAMVVRRIMYFHDAESLELLATIDTLGCARIGWITNDEVLCGTFSGRDSLPVYSIHGLTRSVAGAWPHGISDVSASSTPGVVAVVGKRGQVRLVDAVQGGTLFEVPAMRERPRAVAVHGHILALASGLGTVWLMDWRTGTPLGQAHTTPMPIAELAFSASGEHLAAASFSGKAWVWRTPELTLEAVLQGHEHRVSSVAFQGDDTLATASWDASVRFWDLAAARRSPESWLRHGHQTYGLRVADEGLVFAPPEPSGAATR
jgi:eukaryotic-like serine/threonine-protein kinase